MKYNVNKISSARYSLGRDELFIELIIPMYKEKSVVHHHNDDEMKVSFSFAFNRMHE